MLLGLVFHGGFTYANPSQQIWFIADWEGSRTIDVGIWFLHLFRMATFFLIAGYFAKFLIERKGTRAFLWNRFVRIVCPFVVFYPFLIVAFVISAFIVPYMPDSSKLPPIMAENKEFAEKARAPKADQAKAVDQKEKAENQTGTSEKPIEENEAEQNATDQKETPQASDMKLDTMHMWFLYYLAMFSVAAAILANLKIGIVDKAADWFYGAFWPTLFAPLAIVPALFMGGSPTGKTEAFLPQLWVFGYYGLFFLAGWKLWGREAYLDRVSRYVWMLIPVCAILYAAYYYLMIDFAEARRLREATPPQPMDRQIVMAFLSAFLSVYLTLISLALGKRFLSSHSHALRYVSDASYWIYLVHLPLTFLIQGVMVTLHWSLWIKFPLSVGLTFVVSLGLYAAFVRYTPIGWMLNGYKPIPWRLFGLGKGSNAIPDPLQAKA